MTYGALAMNIIGYKKVNDSKSINISVWMETCDIDDMMLDDDSFVVASSREHALDTLRARFPGRGYLHCVHFSDKNTHIHVYNAPVADYDVANNYTYSYKNDFRDFKVDDPVAWFVDACQNGPVLASTRAVAALRHKDDFDESHLVVDRKPADVAFDGDTGKRYVVVRCDPKRSEAAAKAANTRRINARRRRDDNEKIGTLKRSVSQGRAYVCKAVTDKINAAVKAMQKKCAAGGRVVDVRACDFQLTSDYVGRRPNSELAREIADVVTAIHADRSISGRRAVDVNHDAVVGIVAAYRQLTKNACKELDKSDAATMQLLDELSNLVAASPKRVAAVDELNWAPPTAEYGKSMKYEIKYESAHNIGLTVGDGVVIDVKKHNMHLVFSTVDCVTVYWKVVDTNLGALFASINHQLPLRHDNTIDAETLVQFLDDVDQPGPAARRMSLCRKMRVGSCIDLDEVSFPVDVRAGRRFPDDGVVPKWLVNRFRKINRQVRQAIAAAGVDVVAVS